MSVTIVHNAGFFSCCWVRLCYIIDFFNSKNVLPTFVDSSKSFGLYKKHSTNDVIFDFFEHYEITNTTEYTKVGPIDVYMFQFTDYKMFPFSKIIPFVKKYFEPKQSIKNISENFIKTYAIKLDNCIAVYYRGTDKKTETHIDTFDSFYNKIIDILNISNENVQILIQTDMEQFADYIIPKLFDKNVIVIEENTLSNTDKGIHNENHTIQNHNDIHSLLATCLVMSKCRHIICTSGNVSVWTLFFRENAENVHQNLNRQWV